MLADLRIARAVRAGISAGQKVSGERAATVASVKLTSNCPNRWYICLRGPNHPTGFVTSFYGIYHRNITVAGTSKFHPSGVSHAFPSLAEVTAFLAGARAQWPRAQLSSAAAQRALPPVLFAGPVGPDEETLWRAACYLVRCRPGGFMVIMPYHEDVIRHLTVLVDAEDTPVSVTKDIDVQVETLRGRKLGALTVAYVDLPWDALAHFHKVPSSKAAASIALIKFSVTEGGSTVVVRPVVSEAQAAADAWIFEEEWGQLGDYVTGEEELLQDVEELEPATPAPAAAGDQSDVIRQLQARVLELEAREATGGPPKPTYLGDRELFPGQHGAGQQAALDGATWAKLQSLAGSPPVRLGRGERRPTSITDRPLPMFAKQAEAEVAAEVVVELDSLTQSLTDPMQKLLALQLRQQQTLLTRLAPKPPGDALYHALGGGGNESGSSSGGIRGCAARELFVKQIEGHCQVAQLVMKNAMKDLGVSETYPGLMRDYIERKIPFGDMKLLTMFGHFLACGWETSYNQKDEVMMGFISRGLLFIEQAAVDSGRTQMGWLLSGYPEPNWSLTGQNKRRTTLQPFARLAQPSWVAANVAFVKDLDFLEGRLKNNANKITKEEEQETDPAPKKKWKKKGGKPDKTAASDTA